MRLLTAAVLDVETLHPNPGASPGKVWSRRSAISCNACNKERTPGSTPAAQFSKPTTALLKACRSKNVLAACIPALIRRCIRISRRILPISEVDGTSVPWRLCRDWVSPLRGSLFVPPARGLTPAANTNVAAPRFGRNSDCLFHHEIRIRVATQSPWGRAMFIGEQKMSRPAEVEERGNEWRGRRTAARPRLENSRRLAIQLGLSFAPAAENWRTVR